MEKRSLALFASILLLTSCNIPASPTVPSVPVADTLFPTSTQTFTLPSRTETFTPFPTETATPTTIPSVESLNATVTADLLSCRYGPGPEYLYLFAFKAGARIKLIGHVQYGTWVLVENEPQRCWVHPKFLSIDGDPQTLKPMYPDGFKLIVSPYYPKTTVLSAERKGDQVTVTWLDANVNRGDYEGDNMFPYIIETWRCENGKFFFDPLVSNFPFITFTDQAGCDQPSHGRVFVQEKHGFAGPSEIPWPAP